MKRAQLYSALWLPPLALALLAAARAAHLIVSPLWWLAGVLIILLPAAAVRSAVVWRTSSPAVGDVLYYFRAPY